MSFEVWKKLERMRLYRRSFISIVISKLRVDNWGFAWFFLLLYISILREKIIGSYFLYFPIKRKSKHVQRIQIWERLRERRVHEHTDLGVSSWRHGPFFQYFNSLYLLQLSLDRKIKKIELIIFRYSVCCTWKINFTFLRNILIIEELNLLMH